MRLPDWIEMQSARVEGNGLLVRVRIRPRRWLRERRRWFKKAGEVCQ